MKAREEFWEISLRAGWRRVAAVALVLSGAFAVGITAARLAAADWLAARGDEAALRRALTLAPEDAELHRRLGRLALLSFDLESAAASYQASLRHQSHSSQAWLEYSFLCEARGEQGLARAAVLRAVELAPASAGALQAAAHFFLRQGEWETAFEFFRRAMALDWRVTAPALEACWRWAPDRSQILTRAIPDNAGAYEAYLRFLTSRAEWEEAARVWQWADRRGRRPGQQAALAYVNALLAARRPAEAQRIWQALVPSPAAPANLIQNPTFSQPILNAGFDWRYSPVPDVELAYERGEPGGPALALRFSGRGNPDYWHLQQIVPAQPVTGYRLEVSLKADGITSSAGPRLEVRDSYSGQVLASSEPALGSLAWQRRGVEFVTTKETEAVTIGVRRPAAPTWDEPIAGVLWLRQFQMRPLHASPSASLQARSVQRP